MNNIKTYKTNHQKGLDAEKLACEYIQQNGFIIIGTRIKTKFGEIDILAKANDKHSTNDYYIFEVKTRKEENTAYESVGLHQIQRSINAFFVYAQANNIEFEQIYLRAILVIGNNIQVVDIDTLE